MDFSERRGDESFSAELHQQAATRRKTVLVVDDDTKLLRALQRSLADEDYQLFVAVSAAEAKAFLNTTPVDLVISDNLMHGELGTEFLAAVSRKYPDIELMMLSGYLPTDAAKKALDDIGIARILSKPCQSSELGLAIREALRLAP
ncbi:MAG: response regulator [Phycisphaera sp. RhM]|nr:response regulator [Phycisphaera sp. RhM]